ncbi:NUDIX domain-containing protein [Tsukamurella sp. 8F]|uniref:NUDIX domain-containing protein n=1 Tax=unclassified Tsukamurella TaxID=2633480 RepID=UPI0023B9497D|nr:MULTISPECIES: NUDIX domain-containing protein [unclassified Tsukamurella]MDF0528798.1 NUDIX domain-containing protein [Tsukamurella sp. 8J]MDF0586633.1 NUDIX domain-containing protein [Tsukamurella sp. 8F]
MVTSAGLVLYRHRSGGVQVLIAHMGGPFWAKKDDHAWSIPKGEYTSEEPLSAAEREFAEELGSPAPAGPVLPLGSVRTSGKTVIAFAREGDFDASSIVSNTFTMQWPPRSGRTAEFPEVDRAEWFDLTTATQKLVKGQAPFLVRLGQALA